MLLFYGLDVMGGVINIIIKFVVDEWSGLVMVEVMFQGEDGFENSQQLFFYVLGLVICDQFSL